MNEIIEKLLSDHAIVLTACVLAIGAAFLLAFYGGFRLCVSWERDDLNQYNFQMRRDVDRCLKTIKPEPEDKD